MLIVVRYTIDTIKMLIGIILDNFFYTFMCYVEYLLIYCLIHSCLKSNILLEYLAYKLKQNCFTSK